jgi:hypothetical protein
MQFSLVFTAARSKQGVAAKSKQDMLRHVCDQPAKQPTLQKLTWRGASQLQNAGIDPHKSR